MTSPTAAPALDDSDRLLSLTDLSELLGGIPARSIRYWVASGKGPRALRLGKYLRFRPEDVREWLDEKAADSKAAA